MRSIKIIIVFYFQKHKIKKNNGEQKKNVKIKIKVFPPNFIRSSSSNLYLILGEFDGLEVYRRI